MEEKEEGGQEGEGGSPEGGVTQQAQEGGEVHKKGW